MSLNDRIKKHNAKVRAESSQGPAPTDADATTKVDATRLHKKAQEALSDNLVPGEEIAVVIHGPHNQAIIGTDRRAFVFKKGFMAGASFGSEMTSWDYRNLVGVQIHTGMMSGSVVLQGPGQTGKKTSYWGQGDDDPSKAPNAIPLVRPFDEARAGVAKLRQLMEAAHSSSAHSAPAPPATSGSVADELQKLVDLKNAGALSEEEFADLKRSLLAQSQQ